MENPQMRAMVDQCLATSWHYRIQSYAFPDMLWPFSCDFLLRWILSPSWWISENFPNLRVQFFGKLNFLSFLLCYPVMSSHFSPAPVKNRSCGTNPINQSRQSWLIVNQSINQKVYNGGLRLIDWFDPGEQRVFFLFFMRLPCMRNFFFGIKHEQCTHFGCV